MIIMLPTSSYDDSHFGYQQIFLNTAMVCLFVGFLVQDFDRPWKVAFK
jgi:hypothetical protein